MTLTIAVIPIGGTTAILALTAWILYRGSRDAGVAMGRAIAVGGASALLLGAWGGLSAWIAHQGGYRTELGRQPPWLPIAVGGAVVTLLLLSRLPAVRRALSGRRTTRLLARPHAARVAGVAFLLAMAAGHLPALFAVPAGVGDILVGIAEPFVWRGCSTASDRRAALGFTWFGISDLVVAMALGGLTGYGIIQVTPTSTVAQLPLVLIPTVAVPVLFTLHILTLVRLRRTAPVGRLVTV